MPARGYNITIMDINDLLQIFAVISGLLGSWLVVEQRVDAFYWWLGSNAALVIIQWTSGNRWLIVLYVAYSLMNLYGIRKWKIAAKASITTTDVPGAGV